MILSADRILIYGTRRTSHKFGIALPQSVEEFYAIDEENGNTFWKTSIDKELKKL